MAVRAISEWYPHKYSPNQNESARRRGTCAAARIGPSTPKTGSDINKVVALLPLPPRTESDHRFLPVPPTSRHLMLPAALLQLFCCLFYSGYFFSLLRPWLVSRSRKRSMFPPRQERKQLILPPPVTSAHPSLSACSRSKSPTDGLVLLPLRCSRHVKQAGNLIQLSPIST